MSRPHSPRPPLTPLDVTDAFLKSPAMARQRRRSSASDSATSEPSSERSFRIHAPSRRRGLFKSSNLLLLAIALLCLAVFRLGLNFRQLDRLASWRKDPRATAFQEALARWESTVADEGEAKIWPPDTPADRRALKCIGFNTRAQCIQWIDPAELDSSLLIETPEEKAARERKEERLAALAVQAHNYVRSTHWLAMDWPSERRWNEMRHYIAEAAWHAQRLNRTLILPTHFITKDCVYDSAVCTYYQADRVIKEPGQPQRYKIPMERMIDFDELKSVVPVVTLDTFLILVTPPNAQRPTENLDGSFDATSYLQHVSDLSFASLPRDKWSSNPLALDAEFVHDLAHLEAGVLVHESALPGGQMLKMLQANLAKRKLSIAHTFASSSIAYERAAVVMSSALQQFDDKTTQVLHLGGPHDLQWSAPIFATRKERQHYFDLAVRHIRSPSEVFEAAKRISARMVIFADGRQWITLHGTNNHELAKMALATARERLPAAYESVDQNRKGPHGLTDQIGVLERPLPTDPFLLLPSRPSHARAPDGLLPVAKNPVDWHPDVRDVLIDTSRADPEGPWPPVTLRRLGAITIADDLLTPSDRDALGWLTVFSDYLDMLATVVASRSAMFVSLAPDAHQDGRFAGAVAELRKGFGLPFSSTRIAYADAL